MQINLVPKTREERQKRKQLSFMIIMIAVSILIAVGVISLVLYSTNLYKKSKIKNLESEIIETKDNIKKYSELEANIKYLVFGLDYAEEIIEDRKDWINLYSEVEKLMPKETFLKDISIKDGVISFQAKTNSVSKVAEFIESLRKYEFELSNDSDEEKSRKVKLFTNIEVTNYSKSQDGDDLIYTFEFEGEYTEEIWQKS